MTYRALALCVALTVVPSMCMKRCPAQSLWSHRAPQRVFLFADTYARTVGDLITVVIRETTDVENKDDRALDKSSAAGFNFDFSSSGNGSSAAAQTDINAQSNRQFDGSSQYSVEQQFSDRITATVIDKLPNGNLVLAGQRLRGVSGEQRTLVVSGIVRPIDIRPDNSIESRYIANFRICYQGAGPETAFSNQGWLGRIGNRLWPF